jgi:thiamine biosynthesis lipoprotein
MKFNRRQFLALPALAPLRALGFESTDEHRFHYDHLIGTSMDLAVWTRSREVAQYASRAALHEIARLTRILSTYESDSEIRRLENGDPIGSRELAEVIELYRYWESKTDGVLSIRPSGNALNVDALGKAYIIDRAAAAIRTAAPDVRSLVLNIGGDIVVWGRDCEIDVTDPSASHDNADPVTRITLRNEAVATSGIYARGAHLLDARTGSASVSPATATVIARDAVTANALATTLCIADVRDLVERIPDAEALRITFSGIAQRTSGFARRETRVTKVQQPSSKAWPPGYEVGINVTLTTPDPRLDRSYVAFWVEDLTGKLVRAIALWGTKQEYHQDMTGYWKVTGGDKSIQYRVTRATRAPGNYRVVWNGTDEQNKPVPRGTYRVVVETNRYHGVYAKASATIACESESVVVNVPDKSVNFESIRITYGAKPSQA